MAFRGDNAAGSPRLYFHGHLPEAGEGPAGGQVLFKAGDDFLERRRGLCAALLFLFAFTVFRRMLTNGFVFDDSPLIVENPFILNPHFWKHIFTGDAWAFQGGHSSLFYRPLQFAIYWLIYRLAGSDPAPFHLVNLTLYAATGWLVYRLGRKLLQSETAALIGALLWLVHPLHVEAVAWISALPDLGAGFFYLLAFLLFSNAETAGQRGFGKHVLAALAFLPALFFKEMAVSFPLMVLAYWFFFPDSEKREAWTARLGDRDHNGTLGSLRASQPLTQSTRSVSVTSGLSLFSTRRTQKHCCQEEKSSPQAKQTTNGARRKLTHWFPYLAVALAYLLIRHAVLGHMAATAHLWKISPRVFAAGLGLLGQHAKLFFLPIHMDIFRSFDFTSSFRSPWAWLTLAGLVGATTLRRRDPRTGFLLDWWGVALLPVLDIRQLSFPQVADRFSYLPSVGCCLAISYLCLEKLAPWARAVWRKSVVLAPLAFLFCFWMLESIEVVPNWRNNEAWTRRTGEQSPNSVLLHIQLAENLMFKEGNYEAALREFEEAKRLNQASSWPMTGLGYPYNLGLGRIALRQGRREEAITLFQRAVQVAPQFSEAYDLLGSTYFAQRDYAQAARYFQRAVGVNPYDLNAHFYLGTCLMKLGNFRQAAEQFHAARFVDPTYTQALAAEARALEAAGDAAGAAKVRRLLEPTK
jgi:Flp pilus assembly protein TadD